MTALAMYRRYIAASIRGQMQYRASLAMRTAGVFLICASETLGLWALFDRFDAIRGWRLPEVAVFYGLISIVWALSDAISSGFHLLGPMIKDGGFDRLLVRPRGLVLQLLGQELTLRRLGRLVLGCVVLGYASAMGAIAWSPAHGALLLATIAGGACAFVGVLVLQATSTFWTVEGLEVWNAFTDGAAVMGQYPLAIYRSWFRALYTYVLPIGAATYYPGLALLGRADPLGAPAFVGWLAPLAGPLFLVVCLQVWHFGVRHYRSTGS